MKTKSYENVSESGYGVVRVGNFSANAAWEFFGVQPIIEVKMLGGEVSRRKGQLAGVFIMLLSVTRP